MAAFKAAQLGLKTTCIEKRYAPSAAPTSTSVASLPRQISLLSLSISTVGYQSYPTVVVEGVPLRELPLPLCGIGIGWAL
ncbi:hypothetical protein QJS10_CPA03g00657 [Acorus calamus]|uniref:Uncharacterized protein n=1 Tax=Acorus calamus TaxID=4465 RepID=A0AAV9F5K5_ACOCL|nr:hypothetical protein QJS10_CPA03g00657 [Acorus calamus]